MSIDTAKERSLFEAWAKQQGYPMAKHIDGSYQAAETEDAWFVWCARASLETDPKE